MILASGNRLRSTVESGESLNAGAISYDRELKLRAGTERWRDELRKFAALSLDKGAVIGGCVDAFGGVVDGANQDGASSL